MTNSQFVKCLDSNREIIIELMKSETKNKRYFENLNMTPEAIIDMVCKDYIESLKMIIETDSYIIYREKIKWFKSMSEPRISEVSIKDSLKDFIRIFRNVVEGVCGQTFQIDKVFDNIFSIVEEVFNDEKN